MSREFNCVIIDDEPKAIELLRKRLSLLFPELVVRETFTEWEKGLESLRAQAPDILFLDISMPQKSGIDFLKLFPVINFQVIFITAHAEFAIDAIKFSVAGYVLKPVDDVELNLAVRKAIDNIRGTSSGKSQKPALKMGIPHFKAIEYINIDEILYFESVQKYTKVVTMEQSVLSSYNIAEFRKNISEYDFCQVHRSYIINLHKVRRYDTAGVLTMFDNRQIPVAKSVRADFINVFHAMSKTIGNKMKELK